MLTFKFGQRKFLGLVLCLLLLVLMLIGIPRSSETLYRLHQTGLYNGYLNQTNIVECSLSSSADENYTLVLSLKDFFGKEVATSRQAISSNGTVHFVLNQISEIKNKYGSYDVSVGASSDNLSLHCQTLFYSFKPEGSGKAIDYVYALGADKKMKGEVSGIFNSMDPQVFNMPVYNWLSLYNTSGESFSANIEIYSIKGKREKVLRVGPIKAGQRRDFPLGHSYVGETITDVLKQQSIGIYKIIPNNDEQEYAAFVTRYGRDLNQNFNFAFPLLAQEGGCNLEPLPASTFGHALNWGEIANVSDKRVRVIAEITYRNSSGLRTESIPINLRPFTQFHVPLHEYLGADNVGSFQVRCLDPNDKIIVQSMFYGRKSASDRSLEWSYAVQAEGVFGGEDNDLISLYNTFGSVNWLKVFDSDISVSDNYIDIFSNDGSKIDSRYNQVSIQNSKDIPIHEVVGQNFVGKTKVRGQSAFSSFSIRVFPKTDGSIGYITSVPVFKVGHESSTDGSLISRPDLVDPTPVDDDLCPLDSNKDLPGICGCGVPDIDSDNDGVFDCHDQCTLDASKSTEGVCGCGVPDIDSDNDGVFDCHEQCTLDANKSTEGVCGCGVPDVDANSNGIVDCLERCDEDPTLDICNTADNHEFGVLLNGSGVVMSAEVKISDGVTTFGEFSKKAELGRSLVSLKQDIEYRADTFCVSGDSCPDYTTEDVALDGTDVYSLRTDGQILKNNTERIAVLPNVKSIAKMDKWYLLRRDGAVLTTADLADPSSYKKIEGLVFENASKLTFGDGPKSYQSAD